MKAGAAWLTRLLALLLAGAGHAATVSRVDDSGTVVSQSVVPMRWKRLVPGRGADHTVQAQLRVALRLNLAPWLHQPVRLYMALAPGSGNPVQARWITQGRLLAGALRSGGRTLVYEGSVATPLLEESLDLALETDGRTLVSAETLQFYFEVESK
jgi:hypothetical protein